MKTIKVSEATGAALDWLVAKCEWYQPVYTRGSLKPVFRKGEPVQETWSNYSTNWSQGGPIIERQEIELYRWALDGWGAKDTNYQFLNTPNERPAFVEAFGPTPLIAAMRAFVASKLGDTVEVPEELL